MFAAPWAFWFVLVAIPIAAAFLFRRRLRQVEVPAVQIWEKIGRPVAARSFRNLLRRLLVLLAQLAILAILVLALADPSLHKEPADRLVVVLDVSSTMQTIEDDGQSRFALARKRAIEIIQSLDGDSEVVVLQAAHCPLLLQPLTRDSREAVMKLQRARPLDVDGDLADCTRLAAAFVEGLPNAKVVVISDFAASPPQELRGNWRTTAKLHLVAVGREHDDAGVVRVWSEQSQHGSQVHAVIAHRGMDGRELQASLLSDNRCLQKKAVKLSKPSCTVDFDVALPYGAAYEVVLDADDRLALNNHAFGVASEPSAASICLVSRGNPALECALRAGALASLRVLSPEQYRGPGNDTVVIFDRVQCSLPPDAGQANYLFIGCPDSLGWSTQVGWSDVSAPTHWSADHPCLDDIDITSLRPSKTLALVFNSKLNPVEIAGAQGQPLIIGLDTLAQGGSGTKCIYWLFDPAEGQVSKQLSFPVLLWNTLDYLMPGEQLLDQGSAITGKPFKIALPASEGTVAATGPEGQPLACRIFGSYVMLSDTTLQGFYRVRCGQMDRTVPVNVFSTQALRPLPAMPQAPPMDWESQAGHWAALASLVRPSWQTLAAVAITLLLVEWFLFARGRLRLNS